MDTNGFSHSCYEDREEDNVKLFQYIITPDGKEHWLDHTPYQHITGGDFERYVAYYKLHGRFPERADIGSRGPIHSEDLTDILINRGKK